MCVTMFVSTTEHAWLQKYMHLTQSLVVVCCMKQVRGVRVQSQHVGVQLGILPMTISVLPMFSKLPHLGLLKTCQHLMFFL